MNRRSFFRSALALLTFGLLPRKPKASPRTLAAFDAFMESASDRITTGPEQFLVDALPKIYAHAVMGMAKDERGHYFYFKPCAQLIAPDGEIRYAVIEDLGTGAKFSMGGRSQFEPYRPRRIVQTASGDFTYADQ